MRISYWFSPQTEWQRIVAAASRLRTTGLAGVWVADNPHRSRRRGGLDAWSLLAALAVKVPDVRIGTLVTSLAHRHPLDIARFAVTLDQLSGGRAVLGLGIGGRPGVAGLGLDELIERLALVRSLTCRATAGSDQGPGRPLQPRIPLLVGGVSSWALTLAAAQADEWNGWLPARRLEARRAELAELCVEAGRDPDDIVTTVVAPLYASSDAVVRAAVRPDAGPRGFAGTIDDVVGRVDRLGRSGAAEIVIPDLGIGLPEAEITAAESLLATIQS